MSIIISNGEQANSVRTKLNEFFNNTNNSIDNLKNQDTFYLYYLFCSDINSNGLDACFGKNNESYIHSLGLQMAMYAWFKGENKTTKPYTNLIKCNNLSDISNNQSALNEVLSSTNLVALTEKSPYCNNILANKVLTYDFLNNDSYLNYVKNNLEFWKKIYGNTTYMTQIEGSTHIKDIITTTTLKQSKSYTISSTKNVPATYNLDTRPMFLLSASVYNYYASTKVTFSEFNLSPISYYVNKNNDNGMKSTTFNRFIKKITVIIDAYEVQSASASATFVLCE